MVTQQSAPSSSGLLHLITGVTSYDFDFYHRTFHFFVSIHHLFKILHPSQISSSPTRLLAFVPYLHVKAIIPLSHPCACIEAPKQLGSSFNPYKMPSLTNCVKEEALLLQTPARNIEVHTKHRFELASTSQRMLSNRPTGFQTCPLRSDSKSIILFLRSFWITASWCQAAYTFSHQGPALSHQPS